MARSGSEKRQRQITLKARFTDEEAALIREQATRAGVSVGSLIRYAVLGIAPLRARRRPAIDDEIAARLLGNLGIIASALRGRNNGDGAAKIDPQVEAACRDIAEMRALWFEAFGRDP
jgi:hypothetical protein